MIQISCLYCGKKLTAKDEWVGRNVKCPECNHIFHIPKERIGEDEYKPRSPIKQGEQYWDGKSDEEIAEILFTTEEDKTERSLKKEKKRLSFLIPHYDDLTLFTFSVTLLLLLLISGQLHNDIITLIALTHHDPALSLYAMPVLVGLLLSFANVFLKREKAKFEKFFMLIFAIFVTAGTGIYAGYMMFESSMGWTMVFPVWNIANGVLLLIFFRSGLIDAECITDESASFWQIAGSVIAVAILLAVCQYVFKLHWVYTYSIVVCYTMSLHSVFQDFFPKIMKN